MSDPAGGPAPLIAAGVLPVAAGSAGPGRVELLAWPPVDQLQVGDEVTPVPVAASAVGSDCRFVLRAAPTPLLAGFAAANGGYLNLEMRTNGTGGASMTNFSRYLSRGGTWHVREDDPTGLTVDPGAIRAPGSSPGGSSVAPMAYPFPPVGPGS